MKTSIISEKDEATMELPEGFFADSVSTVFDIDVNMLEYLAITELRSLAGRLGVVEPLSKTQEELISGINKIIEREMEFYDSSSSAL